MKLIAHRHWHSVPPCCDGGSPCNHHLNLRFRYLLRLAITSSRLLDTHSSSKGLLRLNTLLTGTNLRPVRLTHAIKALEGTLKANNKMTLLHDPFQILPD